MSGKAPKATKKPIKAAAPAPRQRARGLRFAPDPGTLAEIGIRLMGGHNATHFGLVLNESTTGCAIVLATKDKFHEGMWCLCRVGRLPECEAEVRWVKALEPGLIKIGIKYLID